MALCLRESILGTGKCRERVICDIQKYLEALQMTKWAIIQYIGIYKTEKSTLKSTLL